MLNALTLTVLEYRFGDPARGLLLDRRLPAGL
jgi:hypothetical protein